MNPNHAFRLEYATACASRSVDITEDQAALIAFAACVAELEAALGIALECLEHTGGIRGPSPADCELAAVRARAALEAK